jgi:hypothetical protein
MAPKILKKAKSVAKDLVRKVANAVKPSNEYVFANSAMKENELTIAMKQQQRQQQVLVRGSPWLTRGLANHPYSHPFGEA